MNRFCAGVACVMLCGMSLALGQASTVVKKTAEAFDGPLWKMSQWNSAVGRAELSNDVAPGTASTQSMVFEVSFSGKGFEGATAMPSRPLVIPGDMKSLTIRAKRSSRNYGLKISFVDGWGRENAGGRALEWWLPFARDNDGWQTFTFNIPNDWVRPISIAGVMTHNWESQGTQAVVRFDLDELEVETDIAHVDPATGALKTWTPDPNPSDPAKALKESPKAPLFTADFSTSEESNVFAGEDPSVTVQVLNWIPGTLNGKAVFDVVDNAGKAITSQEMPLSVESSITKSTQFALPAFGRYTVKASLELSDGTKHDRELIVAKLPPTRKLTQEQRMASPYGLNIHSAVRNVLKPFAKAGIVWCRDYSFQFDWLMRAKGADRSYSGWPYYPAMVRAYEEAGVEVLPVLQQGSMKAPVIKDGKVAGTFGPDKLWQQEMASVLLSFPQFKYWELNNEYDLNADNRRAEEVVGWENYGKYHRQFGELVSILGMGEVTAVENGRAEMDMAVTRKLINEGYFDKIGVINYHFYCGPECPELTWENHNIGIDVTSEQFGSFYDRQRALKQLAQSDGKKRQIWLTEFGWDTLAGPVVSPYEQAVYLQRGWMVAMAAGVDKAFWYWNQYDSAKPQNFFDGCGLLGPDGQPKLSLNALAGMTYIMPTPKYVGSLNAGDNTWGYVFENDGQLVASLWTLRGDNGPTVSFKAEQLYNFLGNKLEGNSAKLTMAPTYAVGIDKTDTWYKQTAYELTSKHLMVATAGDVARPVLTVTNNRSEPINCSIQVALPEGWAAEKPQVTASVQPGEKVDLEIPFTVGLLETQGMKDLKLVISEGAPLRELPFRLIVLPAVSLQVKALPGRPGTATCVAEVSNLSTKVQNPKLRVVTPKSWKVATPEIDVTDLQPREKREVKFDVTWSADWAPEETASVRLSAGDTKELIQPLIPSQYRIYAARDIKLDGDLGDWPARAELPNWMLGTTAGESQAKIYLAWAREGLYGAVEVHNSKVSTDSPITFWSGDALELFLDTTDEKTARSYRAGDHQFWLMAQPQENRVYVGQWKNASEITETKYDIKGVRSAARKTDDGYVMEFLLPADVIEKYQPVVGSKIGVNLNLTVQGLKGKREVFWPHSKTDSVQSHPEWWGTLELAE